MIREKCTDDPYPERKERQRMGLQKDELSFIGGKYHAMKKIVGGFVRPRLIGILEQIRARLSDFVVLREK